MKLVFLDTKTIGDVPNIKSLERFGEAIYYETTSSDQTLERVREADIIITNKVVIDRGTVHEAKRLKLICIAATGTNNVDIVAANELGIPVKNAVDYSSKSVAQGTFAILLQLINKVPYYDNYVKSGAYSKTDIFTHFEKPFWELSGKRFGIIGLGSIGLQVAKIAEAFGAEVVYYSASGQSYEAPYPRLELEEFLTTADVVSIHAPLNQHTSNLINYERLGLMKRSSLLINAGRGGIVNETDLVRGLNQGLIAGAGIDVFAREPLDPQSPLLLVNEKEKLVMTPHSIWASMEARTLLIDKVGQNIQEFLGGVDK
ncbi:MULTISPECIES: D-2-hydroxyacid dehydrogenase [unclassified Imperialibacter]|uniref:D-2-hydroxyacid dehydrogenase n=1 Tax=unclassified Imperialibacter TaxID=2629706 RepID=UPI001251E886|nr:MULTISPECIES: D-2-hydroxyacid dehydrogenase [unclassified Imperialibacter]CAD5255088.1 Hydroxyacid dehydrogenase [Imperialibacter sp. 75]CAD5263631.1 Hydroxyacid dehydrogenase [Imperialibacter sp. 89]VVT35485.1 Hydroxyacid dehydrogenase [Imperialibacter sp. EC-SDR9]